MYLSRKWDLLHAAAVLGMPVCSTHMARCSVILRCRNVTPEHCWQGDVVNEVGQGERRMTTKGGATSSFAGIMLLVTSAANEYGHNMRGMQWSALPEPAAVL